MNILITSASRKVGLVRAFQSALRRTGGGKVIAVDVSACSPALYVADSRFLVPPSTEAAFVDELLKICKREDVALVVPTRDEELPVLAHVRQRFEAAGTRVMVAAAETIQRCADKAAFISFCRERGFGIPRTYESNQWAQARFPLFVKPRFGKGANGAQVVRSEENLRTTAEDPASWIVQEYIDSPEYTIDLLADFEAQVISAVPRRRELVISGESYVSRTVKEPQLIAESVRLAQSLQLIGHNTIQCFWNGAEAKFIEVNPRFGGGAALCWAAGVDTPMMLLRMMKGEKVASQIGQFQPDLTMLRFSEDIFLEPGSLLPSNGKRSEISETSKAHAGTHLQAILFDLDNTLYPEEQFVVGGFRACANFLARRLNLEPESLLDRMLNILQTQGRGKVFDILTQHLEIDQSKWVPTLLQVYRSHEPMLSLFPDTAMLLRSLRSRGFRTGLITDGFASVQRRKISALRLEDYMDVIVCTDELGRGCTKPSPLPFEVALNLLAVSPERAAYVADDISKDFAGPNRLAMKSVQIRSGGLIGVRQRLVADPSYHAQFLAESLREALTLLGISIGSQIWEG